VRLRVATSAPTSFEAPHLVPKKLAPVDKVRTRRLEVRRVEEIARERGFVLGPGAAEALADAEPPGRLWRSPRTAGSS